jgi:hypothetical protein
MLEVFQALPDLVSYLLLQTTSISGSPRLQMRKLRHRGTEWLVQGHSAEKGHSHLQNSISLTTLTNSMPLLVCPVPLHKLQKGFPTRSIDAVVVFVQSKMCPSPLGICRNEAGTLVPNPVQCLVLMEETVLIRLQPLGHFMPVSQRR